MNLDKMTIAAAIDLMLSEEAAIPGKLMRERRKIGRIVEAVARSWRRGGRLFYVGAGTSGRLAVLDASECPPTFQSSAEQVQAIIAGGDQALRRSIERAEDNPRTGAGEIRSRKVNARDVVIGITASGTTPFVWGALNEAKKRDATTVLVCFNPHLAIPRERRPSVMLAPDLGPEILTGSTRLKAGTATKLLLNIFTTLAMVRAGKVLSNLMVDLKPSNAKLRQRAVRIVGNLAGVDDFRARAMLERTQWIIKRAVERLSPK